MNTSIATLKRWIEQSDNIVFFGGAGVSTESGVPDFRSVDGLYNQKYDYPPETILSHSFFMARPDEFYRFYKDKLLLEGIEPNTAHIRLAELEREGKLRAIVTQNVDGLHQLAGSRTVLELHGSRRRYFCMKCAAEYGIEMVRASEGIPHCSCGGIVRPDVVLYEEGLDNDVVQSAARFISNADMLIVGGTSLVVYPAAGLVDLYRGDKLVLINKGETSINSRASLVIREKIGEVFSQV